jgi:geranylgeranyl reductase family protein
MPASKYARYDLTIVGAGPSGAVLAYELAKKGVRVLVVERRGLPRDKTCAGGITVRAAAILPFEFGQCIEDTIYGVRLSFKMKAKRVRTYPEPLAFMVSRDKFDFWLVSKAREAGATVEENAEVRKVEVFDDRVDVTTDITGFSTPLLIGADGANSAVVRSLGWQDGFEYGVGLNGQIPADKEHLAKWHGLMGLDYGIAGGYAWVFPKADHLSVGAGGSLRVANNLRSYALELAQQYGLDPSGQKLIQGCLMPVRKVNSPLSYRRVALVGDAAGVIDPLTGEGIYYGLKSSYLALPAIMNLLNGRSADFGEYDNALRIQIGNELKIARTIQKLNSLTPRLFFHYLQHNDRFWRAFCKLLRGEKTYASLRDSLPAFYRFFFDLF